MEFISFEENWIDNNDVSIAAHMDGKWAVCIRFIECRTNSTHNIVYGKSLINAPLAGSRTKAPMIMCHSIRANKMVPVNGIGVLYITDNIAKRITQSFALIYLTYNKVQISIKKWCGSITTGHRIVLAVHVNVAIVSNGNSVSIINLQRRFPSNLR